MSEHENTKAVQEAYAAFGRGDVKGILSRLSDDIDWEGVVGAGPNVPTRGHRRGHAQVEQFFKQLAEAADFKQFEPREFVAQGDKVVALGHYEAVAKKTGRAFKSDFVMVFTFRGGKVSRFREYADVVAITAAF
jgi:ketosteroid isomerase-like protein